MHVFNHPYDQMKDLHSTSSTTLLNATAVRHQTVTQKHARPFERLFRTGFHDVFFFFWLHGGAFGIGKTAIIQAIAEFLCIPSGFDGNFGIFSFLFQRTLDCDHSFGKNVLDQGYFLDTHIVSARIEHTWTTSIQTAQDISKCSEGNLQCDIALYYHLQRTLTWAQVNEGPLLRCGDAVIGWFERSQWYTGIYTYYCQMLLQMNISSIYKPKCT